MSDLQPDRPIHVLFVCAGNICRSPLAEGVFRHQVEARGLAHVFHIESAGTGNWHAGEAPDPRMQETALENGVSLADLRARQFIESDFERFDHLFAMDKSNLHDMLYLDRVEAYGRKVRLYRELDPTPGDYQVPDPYYGGQSGFDKVYQMIERTGEALLEHLLQISS